MKTKAIMYDLGDIFFEAHLWREWLFKEFSKKKLFKGNFIEFYNLYDSFLSKNTYTKKISYERTFYMFLKKIKMKEYEQKAFAKKAFAKKFYFEKKRKLYPHVKKVLNTLKKAGIQNIILSDNESTGSEIKKNILTRYGISKYINDIITSKECGCTKSNKKFFKVALKKLSLSPDQVLFVGHDQDEIENATQNKIKTIVYNNYLKIPIKSDYRISKFTQLVTIATK